MWLRACLNVRTLDSASALWAWLVTVGNNLLRDELRRNRPEVVRLAEHGDDPDVGVEEFLGNLEAPPGGTDADAIDGLRAKLTGDELEFLNLLCVDNLTHEEVAQRLNLKTAMASRQRLRRIRQRFAE
jgi:DNA-directed RNA polymerase specialized sigma24 family protein